MVFSNEDLRNLCYCAKCGKLVKPKEMYRKCYDINIRDSVCPECNNTSIRNVYLPRMLDNYLYVNTDDKYYTYY